MTVRIKFQLTPAGQKAVVLSGGDGSAIQYDEIRPDSPHYKVAVEQAAINVDGRMQLDLTLLLRPQVQFDSLPSIEELLAVIPAREAAERERKKAEATERKRETREVVRLQSTITRSAREGGVLYDKIMPAWPAGGPDPAFLRTKKATAWLQKLQEENEQRLQVEIDERKRRQEEERQRKAEAERAEAERRSALGLKEGEVDLETESGVLMEAPVYRDRCNNWAAAITIDPSAPGGLGRVFLARSRGEGFYILPASLAIGEAIEFSADAGPRHRLRWYGYVTRIEETFIVLVPASTGEEAVKTGRKFWAETMKEALGD